MNQAKINTPNLRALAATTLHQVVDKGQSLSQVLPAQQEKVRDGRDKALLQQLCYGVLRQLPSLDFLVSQLLEKKLPNKQRAVHFLLMVGVYQLTSMRIPEHAAVAETVAGVVKLKQPRLKGLVNAILRNFQRQSEALQSKLSQSAEPVKFNHPGWLLKRLQQHYPDNWQAITEANDRAAPMWLRPNQQKNSAQEYFERLCEQSIEANPPLKSGAIKLKTAKDVFALPGFADGDVSVQDAAPQFAAALLDPQPGEQVLDACAAPGGKTAHIAEYCPELAQLVAVDLEQTRLKRVHENLARLGIQAKVVCGDAAKPESWWSGSQFDRILVDAPCSATGVIRRHPDIKWLRRDSDIQALAELQSEILDAMWGLLKPGGILLYATCSVLPEENSEQIASFLTTHADAEYIPLSEADTVETPGWQLLPGEQDMDGFYYAKLKKQT